MTKRAEKKEIITKEFTALSEKKKLFMEEIKKIDTRMIELRGKFQLAEEMEKEETPNAGVGLLPPTSSQGQTVKEGPKQNLQKPMQLKETKGSKELKKEIKKN